MKRRCGNGWAMPQTLLLNTIAKDNSIQTHDTTLSAKLGGS
jgi:hypothetical protein